MTATDPKPPLAIADLNMSSEDDLIWWRVILRWRRWGRVLDNALAADRLDYALMLDAQSDAGADVVERSYWETPIRRVALLEVRGPFWFPLHD